MEEVKFKDQQSIFNTNRLSKNSENKSVVDQKSVKTILIILMIICVIIFMKEHIIQMIITIQHSMKAKKQDYDYANAGEPTNRFDS